MRTLLDKFLKTAIRLCMLTGVTFLVTACYGTKNSPELWDEQYQISRQRLEQQIKQFSEQTQQKPVLQGTIDNE